MLRLVFALSLALIASPAAAHTGDHGHIGVFEGILHGLVDHGALIGAAVVMLVGGAFVIKRFR